MAPQKQTIETVAVALMLLSLCENGYNKEPIEPKIHPNNMQRTDGSRGNDGISIQP